MAQRNTFFLLYYVKSIMYNVFLHILNHTLYIILNTFHYFLTVALINALNKGCGVATVLLYSG